MVIRDNINSPAHYTEGRKYETIEVIEDWNLNFRLGNALKYISRTGRKDPAKAVEDLRKAVWYLEREISSLKGEQTPYSVTYEDVLQDYAACAASYDDWTGQEDVDDQPLAHWDSDDSYMFETNVTAATEKDWEDFWGVSDDPLENCWVEISEDEIFDVISRKDLNQFTEDEIVSTIFKRGLIIGVKKDGSTCLLGDNGKCQKQ